MNYMNLLWITLFLATLGDKRLQEIWFHPAGNVIKKRGLATGYLGCEPRLAAIRVENN
jgi:hypothetical protein